MIADAMKARYRRKPAAARREKPIAAGIACPGRGGMGGFTIDEICRETGVSRGLINHHFESKEKLLTRIYAGMTRRRVDAARVARELVASSDGLRLEYCHDADGPTLAGASADCLAFRRGQGIELAARGLPGAARGVA